MKKDREYCEAYDCLIRTCSRHRVHIPKWYILPLVWVSFHEEGCSMYKSMNKWQTLYEDQIEEEDNGEDTDG